MPYIPLNINVYTAAFAGAMASMCNPNGAAIIDPTSNDYAPIASIAAAWAQAVDIAWTATPLPNEYDIECIQALSAMYHGGHPSVPLGTNWTLPATALVAAVRQGDTKLTSLSITPPPLTVNLTIEVKNVVMTNIVNLNAFVIDAAGNDNIHDAENDIVLLVGQTNPAENGPYIVGPVVGNIAPLTRPADWTGTKQPAIANFWVVRGQLYAGTIWRSYSPTSFLVGTDDPLLYPQMFYTTITLTNGAGIATGLWLNGIGYAGDIPTSWTVQVFPAGTTTTSAHYAMFNTVEGAGTGTIEFRAFDTDWNVNNLDTSTLKVQVSNWGFHSTP